MMFLKKFIFLLLVLPLFFGCGESDPSRPTPALPKGGGEYGGGDVLQIPATVNDVVEMVPRVQSVLPYALNFIEIWYKSINEASPVTEEPRSSEQTKIYENTLTIPDKIDKYSITKKVFEKLGQVLFKPENDQKDVFSLIKNLKIEVKTDKPCIDKSGQEKDGSIHSIGSGAICISALRLSKKIKKVHLFNSLLGMVVHEIVHRMGGDKIEAEAKLAEYITRTIPLSNGSLYDAGQGLQLLHATSYNAQSIINIIDEKKKSPQPEYSHDATDFSKEVLANIEQSIQEAEDNIEKHQYQTDKAGDTYTVAKHSADQLEEILRLNPISKDKSTEQEIKNRSNQYEKLALLRKTQVTKLSQLNEMEAVLQIYQNLLKESTNNRNLQVEHMARTSIRSKELAESVKLNTSLYYNHSICSSINSITTLISLSTVSTLMPKYLVALSLFNSHDAGRVYTLLGQSSQLMLFCYTSVSGEGSQTYIGEKEIFSTAELFNNPSHSSNALYNYPDLLIYKVEYHNSERLKNALKNIISISDELHRVLSATSNTSIPQ